MFHVITGGSGSGKSAFAEQCVLDFGPAERIYVATMYPYDEECHARIARHRQMRSRKQFSTVEHYTDLAGLSVPAECVVLLECMSNLTANEMYQAQGAGQNTVTAVMAGIDSLLGRARHLVVVTNEIFSDGMRYDEETLRYQRYLGEINARMGRLADAVTEVVCGIPLRVK